MTPVQKWKFAITYRGHRVEKHFWSLFAGFWTLLGLASAPFVIEFTLIAYLGLGSLYTALAIRSQRRIDSMFSGVVIEDLKPLTETKLQEAA